MYLFRNDYSEGAHPDVLAALSSTNLEGNVGYGFDGYCEKTAALIKEQCSAPDADVQFMVGGTQTNFTAICAFLRPWESVICAGTGHINGHEAGAVEATGHKLLQAQVGADGKLTPEHITPVVAACADIHVTKPGMVYISDATETGCVYTKAELAALSECCKANGLYLFLDGARLGVAFAAKENDLTLPDLARYCDVFYIGGTKNGALMGEALVIVNPSLQKDFFRVKKQRGAVLAKGWLLGVQFDALLRDGLYWTLGQHAVEMAGRLQDGLKALGFPFMTESPTNQLFPIVPDSILPTLDALCGYEVWGRADKEHTIIRFVTSFATTSERVDNFLRDLKDAM